MPILDEPISMVAASVAILTVLVWLMYRSAVDSQWQEISAQERKLRKKRRKP